MVEFALRNETLRVRLDVRGVRRVRQRLVVRVVRARRVAARRVVRVAQLLAVVAVGALLVLELAQPLVVAVDLVAQRRVLHASSLLVVFQAAGAVQPLQVDPAAPPHAHAVHYEPGYYVGLHTKTLN